MPTNKDLARRAHLLDLIGDGPTIGNIEWFGDLLPINLQTLVREGFADADDQQNSAPTIQEFLDFCDQHPDMNIMFRGYAVAPDRDDYRVSIDGFEANARDFQEISILTAFGCGADDFYISPDGEVSAWWD